MAKCQSDTQKLTEIVELPKKFHTAPKKLGPKNCPSLFNFSTQSGCLLFLIYKAFTYRSGRQVWQCLCYGECGYW